MPGAMDRQAERFLDHLIVERGLSDNTVGAYRRDLRRYVAFCARRGIDDASDADPATVSAFVAELSSATHGEGVAYRTSSIARSLAAIRAFHRFLVAEGEAERNPAAEISAPALPRRLPRPLTLEEVERLLEAPTENTPAGIRDRAFLELLYG